MPIMEGIHMDRLISIITSTILVSFAYAAFLVLYRLKWHPLASFPGSKLAASTKWYECFFDNVYGEGGQYAERIRQMHQKYGPIVRINPDELHIHDPSYYGTLYAPLPAIRDKYPPAAGMAGCPLGTFSTVDHHLHRKRRAANSTFFSTKAIAAATGQIHDRIDLLCKMLEKKFEEGKAFKVHTMVLAFTTDIMSTYVLGRPLGCQEDWSMAEGWDRTTRALPRVTPFVKQFPWLMGVALRLPLFCVKLMAPNLEMVVSLHEMMYKESKDHAHARDSRGSSKNDALLDARPSIFDAIDQSRLPPEEKSVPRQAEEAFVLMSAGTETSARAITAIMYHLVANPVIYQRLRHELRSQFANLDRRLELQDFEKIDYLTAVIKEGLRIMQLLTSRLPLVAREDLHYDSWLIPARTPVSMTINDILSDPQIYPNPRDFIPERWLSEKGELTTDLDHVFVPFGRGTRMCQGMNFAWAEMYLCISKLVLRFDFELFDTIRARDVEITRDCFFGTTTEKSPGIRMRVCGVVAPEKVV